MLCILEDGATVVSLNYVSLSVKIILSNTKTYFFLFWCQQLQHRALRKLPQANVAVSHSFTRESSTSLALLLITTDPGAPWILCIKENGVTVVSFKLTFVILRHLPCLFRLTD